MGCVCCVPAKAQKREAERRMNNNGDVPSSSGSRSGARAAARLEEKVLLDGAANEMNIYVPSFSSTSRGSRRGSSRFLGSQREASPSSSFRAGHLNPLASSQICPLVDVLPPQEAGTSATSSTTSDSSASPTISPSKEAFLSTALSTPESFYSSSGDCFQTPAQIPSKSKNLSKSQQQQHPLAAYYLARRGNSGSFSSDERLRSGSGEMGVPEWWSELVGSSRREGLQLMSPEDFSGLEGFDHTQFPVDRIKARNPQTEQLFCGLCSCWLSERSPLSARRMISNLDPPVVGVLSCGHVFHADCLEQATPDAETKDPSCPQCTASTVTKGYQPQDSGALRSCSNPKQMLRIGDEGSALAVASSSGKEKSKPTSKRSFSFKSKNGPVREAELPKTRKSISFSQVSPDNQDGSPPSSPVNVAAPRGSFRYLRGW